MTANTDQINYSHLHIVPASNPTPTSSSSVVLVLRPVVLVNVAVGEPGSRVLDQLTAG